MSPQQDEATEHTPVTPFSASPGCFTYRSDRKLVPAWANKPADPTHAERATAARARFYQPHRPEVTQHAFVPYRGDT